MRAKSKGRTLDKPVSSAEKKPYRTSHKKKTQQSSARAKKTANHARSEPSDGELPGLTSPQKSSEGRECAACAVSLVSGLGQGILCSIHLKVASLTSFHQQLPHGTVQELAVH